MLEAAVFDWAGTTVDFGSLAPMGAFVELFASVGVTVSIAQARVPMGKKKWDHIHDMMQMPEIARQWQALHGRSPSSEDTDRLLEQFIPLNKVSIRKHAELIPGVLACVATLRQQQLKIASTTGYTRDLLDILMPLAAAQNYQPDLTLGAGDTPLGRPSPQMMQTIAQTFGIARPEHIVKIDDTEPGIGEGKNHGSWTVAVAVSGNALGLSLPQWNALDSAAKAEARAGAYQRAQAFGADYVIDTVADLPEIVRDINARLRQNQRPRPA